MVASRAATIVTTLSRAKVAALHRSVEQHVTCMPTPIAPVFDSVHDVTHAAVNAWRLRPNAATPVVVFYQIHHY